MLSIALRPIPCLRPPRAVLRHCAPVMLAAMLVTGCGGGGSNSPDVANPPPNVAPQVIITTPNAGDQVVSPGTLEIRANATDSDGSVASVEFFLNGTSVGLDTTAPFTATVTDPAQGNATITARARDNDGATTTSAGVAIEIVAAAAPAVTLASPEDGQLYATPGAIPLSIEVTNGDVADIVAVEYFADGQLIGTGTLAPDFAAEWTDAPAGDLAVNARATTADGDTSESATASIPIFSQGTFAVDQVQLGDPDTCYGNPEFSIDGRYMVWFEELGDRNADGLELARMWHCAIDPDTGNFDPPDCRGYAGFDTTLTNRAYLGADANGIIYVGADPEYNLTMVRPTGPTTGITTTYDSLQDGERRGIYPSVLPNSDKIYVYWLKSIGGLFPSDADTVELRVVDLDDPRNEIVLSRQDVPNFSLAPMDITFPRWSWQEPVITYGEVAPSGDVEVYAVDVTDQSLTQLTNDGRFKVGQFPVVFNGERYLASGDFPTEDNLLYREPAGGVGFWEVVDTYSPPLENTFDDVCQAASNEPFVYNGRLYTTYQVASCFDQTNVFFTNTSEIWFTELLDGNNEHWKLSQGGSDIKNEPEPLVGTSDVWVYYTRYPLGNDQNTACFEVFRAETPLND